MLFHDPFLGPQSAGTVNRICWRRPICIRHLLLRGERLALDLGKRVQTLALVVLIRWGLSRKERSRCINLEGLSNEFKLAQANGNGVALCIQQGHLVAKGKCLALHLYSSTKESSSSFLDLKRVTAPGKELFSYNELDFVVRRGTGIFRERGDAGVHLVDKVEIVGDGDGFGATHDGSCFL